MSQKDFIPWFKEEFQNRPPNPYAYAYQSWVPKDLELWLNEVEEAHKSIRDKLGGLKKTFKLVETTGQGPADYASVASLRSTIMRIIPNYLIHYDLNETALYYPKLGKFKNMSTAKHILGYADRQNVSSDNRRVLENALSQIGLAWAKANLKGMECYATITTTPESFCLLGRYGIDNSSCFQHGCGNSDKRYACGIMKDSFVLLFHKNETVEEKSSNSEILGRAIGTLSKHEDHPLFIYTNQYPHLAAQPGDKKIVGCDGHFASIAKEFLGLETPEVLNDSCSFTNQITYGYYSGNVVFDKKKAREIPPQLVDSSKKYFLERRGQ